MQFPEELLKAMNPGGRLILSGILTTEAQEVQSSFLKQLEQMGMTGTFSSHKLGEWSDVTIDLA